MTKDITVFLRHILDSIESIEMFVEGLSEDEFMKDMKSKYAVVRAIEIIGEAIKNMPASYRNENPDIPWKDIAGMRDKLMHHYFGIDYKKVWKVIEKDLPELKRNIKKLLDNNA